MLHIDALALGFDEPDRRDLVRRAMAASRQSPDRRVAPAAWCYDDPSGARMYWLDGSPSDSPAVFTHGALRRRDDDPPQDVTAAVVRVGGSVVHADIYDVDGDLRARLLADCDDIWTVPDARWSGAQVDVSDAVVCDNATLTALGMDVTVDDAGDGEDVTPSILPSSLPHLQTASDPGEVYPYAAICGRVLDVGLVTNELTGRQWYRTVVDVSLPLPLALPADQEVVPRVGSQVAGYVRLCLSTGIWDEDGSDVSSLDLPSWWHRDITTFADDAVVGRARKILGAVSDVTVEGRSVTATVFGTSAYDVTIDLDRPLSASTCTCPHHERGFFCKHLVATSLLLGHRHSAAAPADDTGEPVAFTRFLEHAPREALVDLMRKVYSDTLADGSTDSVGRLVRRESTTVSGTAGDVERVLADDVGVVLSFLTEDDPPVVYAADEPVDVLGDVGDLLVHYYDSGHEQVVAVQVLRLLDGLHAWLRAYSSVGMPVRGLARVVQLHVRACQDTGCSDVGAQISWLLDFCRDIQPGVEQCGIFDVVDVVLPQLNRSSRGMLMEAVTVWEDDLAGDATDGAEAQRGVLRRVRQYVATLCESATETVEVLLATAPTPWVTALLYAEAAADERTVQDVLCRIVSGGMITCAASTQDMLNVAELCARITGGQAARRANVRAVVDERLPGVDDLFPLDHQALAQCELMVRLLLADGDREAAWAIVEELELEEWDWQDNDLQCLTGGDALSDFLRESFGEERPGLACWLDMSQSWSLYWADDPSLETVRRHVDLLRRGLGQLADLHGQPGAERAREEVRSYREAFRGNLLVRSMLTDAAG